MRELNYELKQLCLRNRDASFATQYARERVLTMIVNPTAIVLQVDCDTTSERLYV